MTRETGDLTMLRVKCRDASAACLSPSQMSHPCVVGDGLLGNSLFSSPRISNEQNLVFQFKRAMKDCAYSYSDAEKMVACDSGQYLPCNGTPNSKSSMELRKEIATLEFEIMRLERYLLSLYRGAFQEHLSTVPSSTDMQSKYEERSPSCKVKEEFGYKADTPIKRRGVLRSFQSSPSHYWTSSDSPSWSSSFNTRSSRVGSRKKSDLSRRSLADHLAPSFADDDPRNAAERLSDDIVRCISSIYCKLVDPSQTQGHSSVSSTSSSLSSSSIFSSHHPRDSWSPSRNEESAVHQFNNFREECGRYGSEVEVLKICLDDDNFKFAAVMLKKFRLLVQGLESVDPKKLKREEKLAFWINIHNALMMHAYLAYGTENGIKSTAMLKAAYNVGGHSVNTYIIQTSILGIQSNQSAPTLFAPSRKSKAGSTPHLYALDYPEPLVHFALCSGTYSDPPVRAYASNTVFADLKHAKEDYVRANVNIHKDSKIFLPRILYFFAKDMSLNIQGLLDVVGECLSQSQRKVVEKCSKSRAVDKHVRWLPHNPMFRYIIQGDLASVKPAI